MAKCAICGEVIKPYEYEMPPGDGVSLERSPNTFRVGTMHDYCYRVACEEAKDKPATSPRFANRLDEFLTRFN